MFKSRCKATTSFSPVADLGEGGLLNCMIYIINLHNVPLEDVGGLRPYILLSPPPPPPQMDFLDPPLFSVMDN